MGIFLRRGPAPSGSIRIGTFPLLTVLKLKENGVPADFYIAKHDYEPVLNGAGRTLILRKDCYDRRVFRSGSNIFAGSLIDSWLNSDYVQLLDENIRNAIGQTTFYYTPGESQKVQPLVRSAFLLSLTEFGETDTYANVEGTALDESVCSAIAVAHAAGRAVAQWTRTPTRFGSSTVFGLTSSGAKFEYGSYTGNVYSRPVFTLPSDFIVTDDMLA